MKRYFRLGLTIVAMLAVMLFSAAITLRIALHGGEVPIPDFAGKTVAEASDAALHSGLDLNIENRFYSTTIPAGRILSQAPAAGSRVRKGWQVRVTESLGPQQVTIPDVAGEPVRQASIDIRRKSLDLGTLAHIEAPGDADMVLAQTPPPNAGVDQPRVSLLLSGPQGSETSAFVMPSFMGMGYSAANHAAIALGLRVAALGDIPQAAPAPVVASVSPTGVNLDANGQPVAVPVAPSTPGGPVTAQTPEAGHRGVKGDVIRLTFGHPASAAAETHNSQPATPN